jgi:hypothetical protein
MRLNLFVLPHRLLETRLPGRIVSLSLRSIAPSSVLLKVPPPPFLVSDPHRSDLLDDAVDRSAVVAGRTFAAEGGELFRESGEGEGVEVRAAEEGEEFAVLSGVEEDARAGLREDASIRDQERG